MTTQKAQAAFLLCPSDRSALQELTEEIEAQLASQAATILLYGVSSKRHEGFIIVEVVNKAKSGQILRRRVINQREE